MYIADGYLFANVIHYICWAGVAEISPENKNRPAEGWAVDKPGWVRYTIDEKGTTSKAVPQSNC